MWPSSKYNTYATLTAHCQHKQPQIKTDISFNSLHKTLLVFWSRKSMLLASDTSQIHLHSLEFFSIFKFLCIWALFTSLDVCTGGRFLYKWSVNRQKAASTVWHEDMKKHKPWISPSILCKDKCSKVHICWM